MRVQSYAITPAIKAWRPPVPEPLPPAPLLSLPVLAALGLEALAWAWGLLNGRPIVRQVLPEGASALPSGRWDPSGSNRFTVSLSGLRVNFAPCGATYLNSPQHFTTVLQAPDVLWVGQDLPLGPYSQCGGVHPWLHQDRFAWTGPDAGNIETGQLVAFIRTANMAVGSAQVTVTVAPLSGLGVPYPGAPFVVPDGFAVPPIATPAASGQPSPPLLRPVVTPAPSGPGTDVPAAEPSAEPLTVPQTPVIPLRRTSLPVLGGLATRNGALIPATPEATPTTSPGAVVPWPGAAPIPATGPGPAPTLPAMASELGRIERKLEVMMTPGQPGNLVDRIGHVPDLVGPIIQAILAATSGTTYTLQSPCERDEDGQLLPPVEVDAPGAPTQFGAILNRLDALAELLQVHKNQKQPSCRGPAVPVGGEFVTVKFEQVD